MVYVYKIIKENAISGQQIGKPVIYEIDHELKINGLYMHLPRSGGGCWRVLELVTKLQEVEA